MRRKNLGRVVGLGLAAACLVGLVAMPTAAQAAGYTATAATAAWAPKEAPLSTPWTADVSPTNALPDYPRPQLARPSVASPKWLNLNGLWQYAGTDGYTKPTFGKDLAGQILVPYPTESALSGIQKHDEFMFYRKTLEVPKTFTEHNQRLNLNFGAVNYDATVYVNGTQVARHTGGYDAFSVDITGALRASGQQEIVVAVHSPVDDANIPVGKQRNDPDGIFYTAASGIWQSVWLEPVVPVSVASFTATPDVASSSFTVTTTIQGDPSRTRLEVDVYDGKKKVTTAKGDATQPLKITVPSPHLWSPDDPFLYTFKARLVAPGSTDTFESYAGLRSIAVVL